MISDWGKQVGNFIGAGIYLAGILAVVALVLLALGGLAMAWDFLTWTVAR